jgi:hypothetical protein
VNPLEYAWWIFQEMCKMRYKLHKLVKLLRSKNADLCRISIDIFFDNWEKYKIVKNSGVITEDLIANLYKCPTEDVEIYYYDHVMGIKVSFPKNIPTGYPGTRDVDGNQFYVLLRDIEIPSKTQIDT